MDARDPELSKLLALTPRSPGTGAIVVVHGAAGIGKSALCHAASAAWRRNGAVVLEPDRDPASAFESLLNVVREHFEDFGSRGVGDALSAIVRLRADEAPPVVLRSALRVLFRHMTAKRPVVLVLDPPSDFFGSFVVEGARREGCLVVATECPGVPVAPSVEQIGTLADEVIDLPDLSREQIESVVTKALGTSVDDRLMPALRASLGPLAGNPGAVLGAVRALREAGRLTTVVKHVCLVRPDQPIPLHPSDPLLVRVRELGPAAERILTLVAAMGPLRLTDFARLPDSVRGGDADRDGRVLDDLIAAELLVADGDGAIACAFPALAAAAVDGFGSGVTDSVYAELVDSGARADTTEDWPASHFLRSLPELGLRPVTPVDPRAAAERLEAVLAELGADDPRLREVLSEALRTALRAGHFELLGRLVATYSSAADQGTALHGDLAAAAMLAAVHTGRPTPADIAERVYPGESAEGPAAFERWWFGAGVHHESPPPVSTPGDRWETASPLLATSELDLVALAMGGDFHGCRTRMIELRPGRTVAMSDVVRLVERGLQASLAVVFRIVLEDRYGTPSEGPLAVYHRVARDFVLGRWPESVSACRELEVVAPVPTQLHHRARFLAAEVCGVRGDLRQAAEWLDAASEAAGFGPFRAWARHWHVEAESGLAGSLELAQAELARCEAGGPLTEGTRVALSLLLSRGIEIAVELDRQETAEHLLAKLEGMAQDRVVAGAEEHVLLAQAMVHRNLLCAKACAEIARTREHPVMHAKACVVAGRLDADPQPWLHEAYQITKRLRANSLRASVLRTMRELGVTVPRARQERPTFSDTELRIVELLRDGWTNRQIATDIQVTEKTVESYLTRLFAKTGCRTRVDLAAASLAGRISASTD
jgi:DNA-binding CsgD family transcriptional regulator